MVGNNAGCTKEKAAILPDWGESLLYFASIVDYV